MSPRTWTIGVMLMLGLCGALAGGEPGPAPARTRCAPAGGWFPYGGGLLRWWHPCPRSGGPDDYDRKNLPCLVCPPCYPPTPIELAPKPTAVIKASAATPVPKAP